MNIFLSRLLVLGLAFCAAHATLSAAEFRALSWQDSIQDVSYGGQPKNASSFQIATTGFTGWQSFTPGDAPLEFRRKANVSASTKGPAAAGSAAVQAQEVIARVEWPAGLARGLLLFVPAVAGAPLRYQVLVIPERASDARPAAARVFNYSTIPVVVQLGSQEPTQLASRGVFDSDIRPAGGVAPFRLAEQARQGWRVVVSRNLALPAERPVHVFIRNAVLDPLEPNNPLIDYRLIYDRPNTPAVAVK